MTVTVVTCYYIIPNKRPHENYIQWIKNFFSIPCNMHIFTDNNTIELLKTIRHESSNTHYEILPIENFYVSKYDDLWAHSLSIDIEKKYENVNHTVELYKIWAEKIFMCREAIRKNIFGSEIFCWSDIGCVRNTDMFPVVYTFPCGLPKYLEKNKVMFSCVTQITNGDYEFNENKISKIFENLSCDTSCTSKNRIQGGFFAGYAEPLLKYSNMYEEELELFRKTKTFAGKDQYIMTNILLKNPYQFQVIEACNRDYYWDEWFTYLIRFC